MKCPKCENKNPKHAKYCGNCGDKLLGETIAKKNIWPHEITQYGNDHLSWCDVTMCKKCLAVGYWVDAGKHDPCKLCGHEGKHERVGKWVEKTSRNKNKWWSWLPSFTVTGHWVIKDKEIK